MISAFNVIFYLKNHFMSNNKISQEDLNWADLHQNRDTFWVVVATVRNLRIPENAGKF